MKIDSKYGDIDPDVERFFMHFEEPKDSLILEVGANQEYASHILTDNGFKVLGVDLLEHNLHLHHPVNYFRLRGDFCQLAKNGVLPQVDCVFSTSAVEHFGLRTYDGCPGDPDYDVKAMEHMYDLLKPNGTCYLTVPYGRDFRVHGNDWRIYNAPALQSRLIGQFQVETKEFFKSAECNCPSIGREVTEQDANEYTGVDPHLTVFLKLRK